MTNTDWMDYMNDENESFAPVIVPEKFSRPSSSKIEENDTYGHSSPIPQDFMRKGMKIVLWTTLIGMAILVANDFFTALFVKMLIGG